jgi:ferredoxin
MKIIVDRELCCGHARCAAKAPEVFSLDELGYCLPLMELVPVALQPSARLAAANCPEAVIVLDEDT